MRAAAATYQGTKVPSRAKSKTRMSANSGRWLKRACDAGVAPACLRSGDQWRGCRLGFAESCTWLAFEREKMAHEDADRFVARGLHAAACEGGMMLS